MGIASRRGADLHTYLMLQRVCNFTLSLKQGYNWTWSEYCVRKIRMRIKMWTELIKTIRHTIKLKNLTKFPDINCCEDSSYGCRFVVWARKDKTDWQNVRLAQNGMGTRYKRNNKVLLHCNTTSDAILFSLAHHSNSGLGGLILEVCRQHTIRYTHTHTHTHTC